jgi:hypothetical protein
MRTAAAAVMLAVAFHAAPLPAQAPPIFTFQNDFWTNLHHFLYVLGRARNGAGDARRRAVAGAPDDAPDAALTGVEQQAWDSALEAYAKGLSTKETIFNRELTEATRAIAAAGDNGRLDAPEIPADARRALESAAPVYRRVWWPRHRAANEARIREMRVLVERHGAAVRDRIARAYAQRWPAGGSAIHMSAYSNWAGAYSPAGGPIVMSSLDPGNTGATGFETLFHETMHEWDDEVRVDLRAEGERQKKRIPPGLSHAMIFYTAADAVRREIPGHAGYAEANGMWASGSFAPFKPALDRAWLPWLDGKTTREAAIAALVAARP